MRRTTAFALALLLAFAAVPIAAPAASAAHACSEDIPCFHPWDVYPIACTKAMKIVNGVLPNWIYLNCELFS